MIIGIDFEIFYSPREKKNTMKPEDKTREKDDSFLGLRSFSISFQDL